MKFNFKNCSSFTIVLCWYNVFSWSKGTFSENDPEYINHENPILQRDHIAKELFMGLDRDIEVGRMVWEAFWKVDELNGSIGPYVDATNVEQKDGVGENNAFDMDPPNWETKDNVD